jgi:prolyl-tRNA editing enzyme YbaK/EbsC (Cys-tRNA(Pro) deacylase)
LGTLTFVPATERLDLLAEPTRRHIEQHGGPGVWVAEIDASLADTAAFCAHYEVGPEASANCVVVEAKRADRVWHAACVVLATTRADVNGAVRRHLGARKISFAPMDTAVARSAMEYGGITPVGLPSDWPILVDSAVAARPHLVVGSGIRGSKLLVTPDVLAGLPGAQTMQIASAPA